MSVAPVITCESKGVAQAVTDLDKLGKRASDVRRVSEKVRSVYRKSNEQRFAGEAGWRPLADSTVERKVQGGFDPRPERRTGALYRALTSPRASGQVDVRDPSELRFGTTLPYARYQQGTGHQPKRDLIDLRPSERKEIDRLIAAYIARDKS